VLGTGRGGNPTSSPFGGDGLSHNSAMKKIQGYLWPTLLALAVAIGVYIGGKLHFSDAPDQLFTANSKKDKLNRLIDFIDHEYVDEVNTDSIVDVTVNNILGKLDPHSVYISKREMEDRKSTRLNSSHVKSSYAVFCLKIKRGYEHI